MKTRRLSRREKLFLSVPVFASAITAPASGSIIYFQVIPGNGNAGGAAKLYFNMDNGYIAPFNVPGMDFRLYMRSYNNALPKLTAISVSSAVAFYNSVFTVNFSQGSLIDGSANFNFGSYLHVYSSGPWTTGGSGYAGLKFGSNYGWANITYDGSQLHLISFAYENSGAGIHAGDTGSVPEPAQAALLGVVVAGSAAAYAARRKRKLAKRAA